MTYEELEVIREVMSQYDLSTQQEANVLKAVEDHCDGTSRTAYTWAHNKSALEERK